MNIRSVILLALIYNLSFCSDSECKEPASGLWAIISDENDYYEFYWDRTGNIFIYDDMLGEAFMTLEEDRNFSDSLIGEINNRPPDEKEIISSIIPRFFSIRGSFNLRFIGRYAYNVDSNRISNFQVYRRYASRRSMKFHKANGSNKDTNDNKLRESEIIIYDTIN